MSLRAGLKTILFFLAFVLSGLTADAAEIRLKPLARLHGPIVLLGDVADVRAADTEQAERLRRLELFPAPAPGTSRNVRQQEIRELLALNGVDADAVALAGAAILQIHTDTRSMERNSGSEPATDALKASGRGADKTPEPAAAIVVATRDLARGDVVRDVDVELRPIERPVRGVDAVTQLRSAVGWEVTRPIAAGQPLDSRTLQRPLLIRRGQTVTVCARAQGVSVRTTAKALEDGSRDDLILLESQSTKQRYAARVVGPQQAEVYAMNGPLSRISSTPAPATPMR